MRVLVACEFSGIVRDAFRYRGHDAWSCDLLESECPGPHYRHDIRDIPMYWPKPWETTQLWDLMIAHPPCTHLEVSGELHFKHKQQEQAESLAFVKWLWGLPVDKICLENPIGILSTHLRKPDQIIQPWQYGHPESKATCLWLKGLPRLQPTNILTKTGKYWENQTPSGQNKLGPSPDRWKQRSRTYWGIAQAMAEQWG